MYPPEAAKPSITTTTGFFALSLVSESLSCSEPATVPPGLLMWTMTARAGDSASWSSASVRCWLAHQAFDLDAGDGAGRAAHAGATGGQEYSAAHNGDDGNKYSKHAPERQLAPHAAAVDDMIGIERHGFGPLAPVIRL